MRQNLPALSKISQILYNFCEKSAKTWHQSAKIAQKPGGKCKKRKIFTENYENDVKANKIR